MTDQKGFQEDRLAAALAAFAASVRAEGERPAAYWTRRRAMIRERIAQQDRTSSLRLAWASALAVVTLATLLLTQSQPPLPQAMHDPDHDLLLGVENATRRPVPKALEPAVLLAQEMEQSAQSKNAKP